MAQILIVIRAHRLGALARLLEGSGHRVVSASSFEEAVGALSSHAPDLVIAEVRLGAHNALPLVIRGRESQPHMRAILLDRIRDRALEAEAQRHGAAYLAEPVSPGELLAQVSRKLAEAGGQRRWFRKHPAGGLAARVAQRLARVVDLSYEGLRFEVPQARIGELASTVDVSVPAFGLTVRAKPVWTQLAPSGLLWCGAALSEANPDTLYAWRRLVDSVSNAVQ
jgi:twitching motility two-component system response regulator PilH